MKIVLLTFILGFYAQLPLSAQAPKISDAPKVIQELSTAIQGQSPARARAEIIKHLGPAQRDVGSGLRIEQWDTPGGVLTFNPVVGPTFFDSTTSNVFRLFRTTNAVHDCILQSYEMTTLGINGTRYWLGNVEFSDHMTYRFTDSGQHPNQRGAQGENFFMLYPTGKVEIRYIAPVTGDSLLETLQEGTALAHLAFTSANGKHKALFSIKSSERARRLDFAADKPLPFLMDTSWKNVW